MTRSLNYGAGTHVLCVRRGGTHADPWLYNATEAGMDVEEDYRLSWVDPGHRNGANEPGEAEANTEYPTLSF